MNNIINYSEQRQHINLSNKAYDILSEDLNTFHTQLRTISGYINLIIREYLDDSDASISFALERKKNEYIRRILQSKKEVQKNEPLSISEINTINLLVNEYKVYLIEKISSYPKEKVLKIRLQNDIYQMFYPAMPESNYYDTQGQYIKAIIEDFVRKPILDREVLIYKNFYYILKNTCALPYNQRPLLKIAYGTAMGNSKVTFLVKPYDITIDPESQHHYFIGLSKKLNESNSEYIPAALRLSRISKITPVSSYGSGKITHAEESTLIHSIHVKGIQFLFALDEDIEVKLTPQGYTMYKNMSHLRPLADSNIYIDDSGYVHLHFHCTQMQIYNYFFKFGKNAIILSPIELSHIFFEDYLAATKNYSFID